jgi:hypothetical protein
MRSILIYIEKDVYTHSCFHIVTVYGSDTQEKQERSLDAYKTTCHETFGSYVDEIKDYLFDLGPKCAY